MPTPAFYLPEGSLYKRIASAIISLSKGDLNHYNELADVVARSLVRDMIGGRSGQISRGSLAYNVSLALWLLPTRLFEWVVHFKRGFYDL